jgi:Flp pilus assembly protein TadD
MTVPTAPKARLPALTALAALCAAVLLAGCNTVPVAPQWAVTPLLRVDHAGGDAAAALYRLGRHHQQRGELDAAADAFARSIGLQPGQLDARNAQAVLLAGQGKLEPAAVLLRELVAAFPDQAQPLNNLGYVYYLQGKPAAARAAVEQALRRQPNHPQASANLATLSAASTVTAPGGDAGAAPVVAPTALPVAATAGAPAWPSALVSAPTQPRLVQVAPNIFNLEAPAAAVAQVATITTNPASPTSADNAAVAVPAAMRIVIINGNGARGAAKQARRLLTRHGIGNNMGNGIVIGISSISLGNAGAGMADQRGRPQRDTVVEYLPGRRPQAEDVRAALGGHVRLVAARALPGAPALRVVLGEDQRGLSGRRPARAPATAAVAAVAPAAPAPSARLRSLFVSAPLLSFASGVPHFTQE